MRYFFAKTNVLRDAFPTAVGFTDASWTQSQFAEVDATSCTTQTAKLASVAVPGRTSEIAEA